MKVIFIYLDIFKRWAIFIFNPIQEKRIKSSLGPVYMYVGDLR